MSSVSGIRLPGLATGMDTDTMIKEMLTGEQNKIDKVKQKEQTIKWQQEIYREIMKDIKGFNDSYFSLSSPKSLINSSAWSTLTVSSSNSNVLTATGNAGASKVDYNFNIKKLAESAKAQSSKAINGVEIKKDSKLSDLGLSSDKTFAIKFGEGDKELSENITIRTEPLYETNTDGSFILDEEGNKIVKEAPDTIDSLISKINSSTDGKIKASYSEMTGKFTIESTETGSKSGFSIVGEGGIGETDALDFLGFQGVDKAVSGNRFKGSNSEIEVIENGIVIKNLEEESNSFTIDGITYNVHSTGTSEITSKQDVKPVVDNMKTFVDDYNKIMDKIYDLVTQKPNKDYPPLTESQRKEMSEDEIEMWDKKAKQGMLRNDSDMRRFMDDMQKAIFGDKLEILNEMGLTSHEDYNKRGQISLDQKKFTQALENNSQKVYEIFAKDGSSVIESMKSTMNKYVGGSSSVFARKAGLEKTASAANSFYSEQLKRQEETIKKLQRKMSEKESQLYKKFGTLEASMNKLNSQMNYFAQA